MTRFFVLSDSPVLLCVAATAVAVVAPSLASAQGMRIEDKNGPITINADRMTGRPDREVNFENHVEIQRGPTTINADSATYRVVEDEVEAKGNIKMQRLGDVYTGEALRLKIESNEGFVVKPTYKLQKNNAQGSAERIDFESEDRATITDGCYTTCEGLDPDWYLKADVLSLDRERDTGYAKNTVVYFKGVPIIGAPALSFPLSDARKSGFLPPTIGTTNKGGLEVTMPYYFNIAPNRDLTLYPKLIARRGLQIGADGRYLGETYNGETRVEALFNDQQTKTNRYALSSTHNQVFDQGRWRLAWNINSASDDNYPSDFARTITASTQRLLLREMTLNYGASWWTAGLRASNYQVLQDPAAPITRPYDRLPQLTLLAARQDVKGFDWSVYSELTRFWNPDTSASVAPQVKSGDRLVINPSISYPLLHPAYFVVPKLSLHATQYRLDALPGNPNALSRTLPTFSLDSGLVFERQAHFFGIPATQTLEPRLFYVYTPYRDQSQFPNFDTSEADFSYPQLFSENRFIGHDRISDANQLTAAIVSRYLESTGAERARFAVGQRYYFNQQRVSLGTPTAQTRSDLLLSASGRVSQEISAEINMQYSQSLHSMVRSNYGVRWQPGPMRVLNAQYRRDQPNALEQFDVSGQWPIARRWYGVGRINYSLKDQKVAESLAGFEYKADCWVFRAVLQRTPTSAQAATTGLFLQLELNGLSRIGSNPLEALRTSIPGYQVVNPRASNLP
ncbi:MAG: LPS-assembly protein LptD [Burkholderiales bacterium]|nr:LPS-assembly protein LptD [Burkholderiales bacterium]